MSTSTRRRSLLGAAACAPAAAVTVGMLLFAARELTGDTPFSPGRMRNVAEAAGTGEASEILRMLRQGQDPRQVWPVRPEIISSTITRVSALEAAVWSRRAQVMVLLDRQGAITDEAQRRDLACLAADISAQEVVDYLSPSAPPECEKGKAMARVLARTPAP
jgi:hypothetical protein